MTPSDESLHLADLQWQDGVPISAQFGDVYFSKVGGLAETEHVFINGNNLKARFAEAPSGIFTIAETGFGTGLNFLLTAHLWLQLAAPERTLHFFSSECFPLSRDDLCRAHNSWPELAAVSATLQAHYPPLVAGIHSLSMFDGRVVLHLLLGDNSAVYQRLVEPRKPDEAACGSVDAWFLDGFAPAKNPQMWTPELFRAIAQLSHDGTTLATFTAAGAVRRGLTEVGFAVQKVAGFGRKREMVQAVFSYSACTPETPNRTGAPHWWLAPPLPKPDTKQVAIIGAGIGGCTLANALARRGWQVTLFDRHPAPAMEASGNPQGILYPKLSHRDETLPRLNLQALLFSQQFYQRFWHHGIGAQCGVLVLPESAREASEFEKISQRFGASGLLKAVDGSEISDLAGYRTCATNGLFYPGLGWTEPPLICRKLLDHPAIGFVQLQIDSVGWHHDGWRLSGHPTQFERVVIACANSSMRFAQTAQLPLKPIRGQISIAEASGGGTEIKTVICGKGYIAPASNGQQSFGATYDLDNPSLEANPADDQRNIDQLLETDNGLAFIGAAKLAEGRAALRCTTPDYLPLSGKVPVVEDFLTRFGGLRKDARKYIADYGSFYPGLYIHCGFGSRGLTYAPLTSEWLAAEINGECGEAERSGKAKHSVELIPCDQPLREALQPGRFLIRDLKRNRR